jgi:hypothetical protein
MLFATGNGKRAGIGTLRCRTRAAKCAGLLSTVDAAVAVAFQRGSGFGA